MQITLSGPEEELLYDPQTSGGLLMGVAPGDAEALCEALHRAGYEQVAVVGTVEAIPGGAGSGIFID